MQLIITYLDDCQDPIIGVWVCFYFKVASLITLNGVYGSPCRAVWGVFVRHVHPQRRGPDLIFIYFAGALLFESKVQRLDCSFIELIWLLIKIVLNSAIYWIFLKYQLKQH